MTPEAEALRRAMIALDMALTGRPEKDAAHMAHSQRRFFEDPAVFATQGRADGYYLSDGGYSRVLFDDEAFAFRLSSVSRDEVKRRWREDPAAKAAAEAAAAAVRTALDALPGGPHSP